MAYGYVYLATDTTNGKSYCGQDTRAHWTRREEHLRSEKNDHFHNALRKRPDAFCWTVLCECESLEELNVAEVFYGEMFDCLHPVGYSLKLGEARGKCCEETKARMSASRTGPGNGMFGKKHAPETVALIREKRKEQEERQGSPRSGTGKRPRKLCECGCGRDFVLTYPSRRFFERACYLKHDAERLATQARATGVKSKGKRVVEVATGRVFESARQASRELSIPRGKFLGELLKGERVRYVK